MIENFMTPMEEGNHQLDATRIENPNYNLDDFSDLPISSENETQRSWIQEEIRTRQSERLLEEDDSTVFPNFQQQGGENPNQMEEEEKEIDEMFCAFNKKMTVLGVINTDLTDYHEYGAKNDKKIEEENDQSQTDFFSIHRKSNHQKDSDHKIPGAPSLIHQKSTASTDQSSQSENSDPSKDYNDQKSQLDQGQQIEAKKQKQRNGKAKEGSSNRRKNQNTRELEDGEARRPKISLVSKKISKTEKIQQKRSKKKSTAKGKKNTTGSSNKKKHHQSTKMKNLPGTFFTGIKRDYSSYRSQEGQNLVGEDAEVQEIAEIIESESAWVNESVLRRFDLFFEASKKIFLQIKTRKALRKIREIIMNENAAEKMEENPPLMEENAAEMTEESDLEEAEETKKTKAKWNPPVFLRSLSKFSYKIKTDEAQNKIMKILKNEKVVDEEPLEKFEAFIEFPREKALEIKTHTAVGKLVKEFDDQEVTNLCQKISEGILSRLIDGASSENDRNSRIESWFAKTKTEEKARENYKPRMEKFKTEFLKNFSP